MEVHSLKRLNQHRHFIETYTIQSFGRDFICLKQTNHKAFTKFAVKILSDSCDSICGQNYHATLVYGSYGPYFCVIEP